MSALYKITSLLFVSIFFVHCSDSELNGPSVATTTTTTTTSSSTTTTTMSYGACERTQDTRFSIEVCDHPDKCHVKDIGDGYCRPSCGYLAAISENGKYAHYGPDTEYNTTDDPHFLSPVPCNEFDKWEATDWKKISLVNNLEPWEVAQAQEDGRTIPQCCGSDQQVAKNNGEYEYEEEEDNTNEEIFGEGGEI